MARPIVELSGIPELRRYCQSIPAAAQFEAVTAYLQHQVPSMIGSIRQWLLQGAEGLTVERAQSLRNALESSKAQLLQVCRKDFRRQCAYCIVDNSFIWA